jgi:hypothetical protein
LTPVPTKPIDDLAVLAAAHAFDTAPTVFDILVSDPVDTGARPNCVAMASRC